MASPTISSPPRYRSARPEDALLVAALTLQSARAQDLRIPPGFLDRFAESWLDIAKQHPVWICEADGEHAGYLQCARIRPLPWPGVTGGGELREERLFVRADFTGRHLEEGLRAAAAAWAASRGVRWVPGPHT